MDISEGIFDSKGVITAQTNTHASTYWHVFLQHDQQIASSGPPLGLYLALTQCKTCSETIWNGKKMLQRK